MSNHKEAKDVLVEIKVTARNLNPTWMELILTKSRHNLTFYL